MIATPMRRDEHKLQNAMLIGLSEAGALTWRNTVGTFRAYSNPDQIVKVGTPGQADVFCVYQGRFYSIELKAAKGRKRDRQVAWEASVHNHGAIHLWAQLAGDRPLQDDIAAVVEATVEAVTQKNPTRSEEQAGQECHPIDRSE